MAVLLNHQGYAVYRKRIQRLYKLMGIAAIYPKRDLSKPDPARYKYPYLLRGLKSDVLIKFGPSTSRYL